MFHHFTSTSHLRAILTDRALLPSESNIGSPREGAHVGPDVVWLLDEATPTHGHGLEHSTLDKTGVRFSVEVPAIRWTDWQWASRMDPRWKESILATGGGTEAAGHWYVWPAVIPSRLWSEVALRQDDGTYLPLPAEEWQS